MKKRKMNPNLCFVINANFRLKTKTSKLLKLNKPEVSLIRPSSAYLITVSKSFSIFTGHYVPLMSRLFSNYSQTISNYFLILLWLFPDYFLANLVSDYFLIWNIRTILQFRTFLFFGCCTICRWWLIDSFIRVKMCRACVVVNVLLSLLCGCVYVLYMCTDWEPHVVVKISPNSAGT